MVFFNFIFILPLQILTYNKMKLLRKASFAIVIAVVFSFTFQCSSSKEGISTFTEATSFKVKPAYFQEWYAGIKVGGTGYNIFIPVVNEAENVVIDSVYFKNLKGKLTQRDGRYSATLKNKSRHYIFVNSDKDIIYPFSLKGNECAISYIENGQTKYLKISKTKEMEGTYYEHGPPSRYANNSTSRLATTDDDEDGE